MDIKALGGCCKKSQENYKSVVEAVKQLGLEGEVIHVTDMNEIMNLGVMSTPGLIINGKIMATGRMLNVKQAKELINKALKEEEKITDK